MDLKIDPEMMRQLVQKAVLDGMTPEAKDAVLVKAIASLFQPDSSSYGRKTSPLEDLFSQEASNVAREVIRAEMQKPENVQRVRDMIVAAWERVMADPEKHAKALGRMTDALTDALVSKEYR